MSIGVGPERKAGGDTVVPEDPVSVNLPGMENPGETLRQSEVPPTVSGLRARLFPEQAEVATPRTGAPARGSLGQPGEPLRPFRVCPDKEAGGRLGTSTRRLTRSTRPDGCEKGPDHLPWTLCQDANGDRQCIRFRHAHELPVQGRRDPGW